MADILNILIAGETFRTQCREKNETIKQRQHCRTQCRQPRKKKKIFCGVNCLVQRTFTFTTTLTTNLSQCSLSVLCREHQQSPNVQHRNTSNTKSQSQVILCWHQNIRNSRDKTFVPSSKRWIVPLTLQGEQRHTKEKLERKRKKLDVWWCVNHRWLLNHFHFTDRWTDRQIEQIKEMVKLHMLSWSRGRSREGENSCVDIWLTDLTCPKWIVDFHNLPGCSQQGYILHVISVRERETSDLTDYPWCLRCISKESVKQVNELFDVTWTDNTYSWVNHFGHCQWQWPSILPLFIQSWACQLAAILPLQQNSE